ncbi:MAG: hypothetical protein IJ870_01045 [Alphaproteobacteria bacterium]|nr:hypothetical protein [Alphaproteobacteria bacterium]
MMINRYFLMFASVSTFLICSEVFAGETVNLKANGKIDNIVSDDGSYQIWEYNDDGSTKQFTSYDSSGNVTQKHIFDYQDETYSINRYDANNNLIKKFVYDNDHEYNRLLTYANVNTVIDYNTNGSVLQEYRYTFNPSTGFNSGYDRYKNGSRVGGNTYSFEFYTDGRVKKYYEGSKLAATFTYDEHGNMILNGNQTYTYLPAEKDDSSAQQGDSVTKLPKRIYTIDEAERVSKPTGNTFRLRYK